MEFIRSWRSIQIKRIRALSNFQFSFARKCIISSRSSFREALLDAIQRENAIQTIYDKNDISKQFPFLNNSYFAKNVELKPKY